MVKTAVLGFCGRRQGIDNYSGVSRMRDRLKWTVICVAVFVGGVMPVAAQTKPAAPPKPTISAPGILDQLDGGRRAGPEELKLSGEYKIGKGTRSGRLSVRAEMLPGWHVYSATQKSGGPMPSQIIVTPSPDFQITRPFVADRPPHVVNDDVFPVLSEKHEVDVIWNAPFKVAAGVDPQKLQFTVKFSGQVCEDKGSCIPINKQSVEVKYAGEFDPPNVGQFQPKLLHAKVSGYISPRTAMPGAVVKLSVTAEPQPGYHVYAYAPRDPKRVSKPTLIVWKNNPDWKVSAAVASEKPIEHASGVPEEPVQYYHEKPVTWTVDLQIPADAAPGGYELQGLLGLQTCKASGCDPPTGTEFRAVVEVAKLKADQASEPLAFALATYNEAAKIAEGELAGTTATTGSTSQPSAPKSVGSEAGLQLNNLRPVSGSNTKRSMLIILPTALLAGFLLNFMPCVLPVIGLKIVSFVNQSGENRSRIFMLNLWYALGVLSIFIVLASLAVFAGFSWGDQFRSPTFNVVLACVVFAFALSFLGVWEIPLPGFVGSRGSAAAAEKEGAVGAFFKGVLSTVLATPCGGPLLAPALTWAVAQPPLTAYLGFVSVGVGMAFPYLLVGAFPRLVAFLPKPGEWMETFKQLMGFVLMGTVVFVLTLIPISLVIPTVAMMIGLWTALWWVGRVPVWDDLNKRIRAWAAGTAFAVFIGLVSYLWLDDVMNSRFQRDVDSAIAQRMSGRNSASLPHVASTGALELPWQPYSHKLLTEMVANKRTVFVDFTADWCLTCKMNEKYALNVAETKAFVDANQIVTLKADMTHEAPDADQLKASLGGSSIPLYAVFSAGAPNQPIVFDGPITKSRVIEALKKAVSQQDDLATAAVGNRVAQRAE